MMTAPLSFPASASPLSIKLLRGTRVACLIVGLSLCGLISGCSDSGTPCSARGIVEYDGKPLAKGSIRFSTEDGTPGPGGLTPVQDGKYEIPLTAGLKAGKYLIVVLGFRETGKMIKPDEHTEAFKEEIQFLPARYNSNSKEHTELSGGENIRDFQLTP
jgi:hypothetical protein